MKLSPDDIDTLKGAPRLLLDAITGVLLFFIMIVMMGL